MKRYYDTPDFELVSLLLTEDVLGTSIEPTTEDPIPTETQPFTDPFAW